MANRFEVIDADGHITEEDIQLKKYMAEKYVKRAATLTPRDSWDRSLSGTLGTRARDAKSWLDAMDKGGVSTAVLYPTNGLSVAWIREPDVAVALVPFQDVPEAVKELRRAVKELKLVGLMLPAVGLRLPLGHESFWPIYEEAEKLDCMVGVHATVRGPHYFAADMFDQFIEVHTLSHSFAQMMQCCSLMFRGVFDRFPKLRVAFMEAGCSWAPYWFGRMNEEWEKRGAAEAPNCRKKPTEYLKEGRIYLHAEDYEPLIGPTTSVVTHKVIYYASDYPHWDTEFPENIEHLSRREDLNDEAKKWLFAETAKKLYNLQ